MQHQVQIDGISRCSHVAGKLRVRVVHESGQYEDLPCTFQPLIDWIAKVGVKTAVDKLIDHPMLMVTDSGGIRELRTTRRRLPAKARRTKTQSTAVRSSRRSDRSRRSQSVNYDVPSAGIRICPSCDDAVSTVLSFEHGKRMYRCKSCGAITGYS